MTIQLLTLRTGAEVPDVLLASVSSALGRLWATNPIAVFELVSLARDPNHELSGNSGEVLERFGLLQGGRLHGAIKDIVLASTDGEDVDIRQVSPLA